MPRPKKAIPSIRKNICLPEPLVNRVDLILHSELEGKVPFAAWQEFIIEAVEEKLKRMEQGLLQPNPTHNGAIK
jgi:hypothetical protein